MTDKRERLDTALLLWGKECESKGWNDARNIYDKPRSYRNGFEDGRVRGAKDMQNALEKELGERELKGYRLGYELGETNGYDTGFTKGLWQGQGAATDLAGQLTRAIGAGKRSYEIGKKQGYDKGHSVGYYKGRATMKTQIETMLLEEIE